MNNKQETLSVLLFKATDDCLPIISFLLKKRV
ncbi:MAG: hypothetical protein A4E53_04406 [Pelotomaculum sp. PtaB.Bin104]|nr:MAG: hypothetical protein A4E53_04406 [Pelotomaculum sp. PtaB.Bin104]